MKKRMLAAFMAAVMCALLCACGEQETKTEKETLKTYSLEN